MKMILGEPYTPYAECLENFAADIEEALLDTVAAYADLGAPERLLLLRATLIALGQLDDTGADRGEVMSLLGDFHTMLAHTPDLHLVAVH
jgi:hypothetical protein